MKTTSSAERVGWYTSALGAAGFLADQLNRHSGERRYDYLDFYMGHHWIAQRVDLTPVYAMVFRRLKRHGLNWSYRYPQLHIFAPPAAHRDKRSRRELDKLKALLRRANREALNALKHEPAPAVVLAYRSVYGAFPRGWPPWERVPAEPQGC